MYSRIITTLLVAFMGTSVFAQQAVEKYSEKYPSRKLTTDLGIGIPIFQTLIPERDWLLGSQTQFNLNRKLSIISHTGLLLYASTFHDAKDYLKTNHSYSLLQKFGIGTTFYTKGTANGFFLMGGFKYSSVKSTMNNPDFPQQTMSYSSLISDYGVLYNLKVGKKKYFFSGRVYIPLNNLPLEPFESSTIELGVGTRLIH
ncbi:MAG: hypothetical protein ABI378_06010 [Chitinophagaceae bacterium]